MEAVRESERERERECKSEPDLAIILARTNPMGSSGSTAGAKQSAETPRRDRVAG